MKISICELVQLELYLLKLFEKLLQLHLIEIYPRALLDCLSLRRIVVQIEGEFDLGCADIFPDDLRFLDLGVVEHHLIVLLNL